MAIKADRYHVQSDISYFMNTTAERGGVVCPKTVGSGSAMDSALAVVEYATDPSGKIPVGVLMSDVVNLDLTRQHINWYKEEVQVGGKVTVWTKGDVVTNMIYPGETPAANKAAYVGPSGLLLATDNNVSATPIVGVWKSSKDEDGYAKVSVNLPMATPRL